MRTLHFALYVLLCITLTIQAAYIGTDCQERIYGCDYYLEYSNTPDKWRRSQTNQSNNQTTNQPTSQSINESLSTRRKLVPGAAELNCSDVQSLLASVYWETPYRLRVTITDRNNERFVIPDYLRPDLPNNAAADIPNPLYSWEIKNDENGWNFVVKRSDTNMKLFDTQSLQFCDQFIQLSTDLQHDHHLYGFGTREGPLRIKPNTYTMWNIDPVLVNQSTSYQQSHNHSVLGYGSHPAYWSVESDAHVHSVAMYNANAMDIVVTDECLIYQTTGGIIDLTFLLGPDPASLARQYAELVGLPAMPPAWALGFHASEWGLHDVDVTKQVVDQHLSNHFPLDAIWNDRDHLSYYFDWTLDPQRYSALRMKQLHAYLEDHHIRHLFTASAGIPALINHSSADVNSTYFAYPAGIDTNIFIRTPDNVTVLYSCGQPGVPLAFPDFSHQSALPWWRSVIDDWLDNVGLLHGVILTDSEITTLIPGQLQNDQTCISVNQSLGPTWSNLSLAAFNPGVSPDAHSHTSGPSPDDIFPPAYLPGSLDLNAFTLNISSRMVDGHMYNMHNLYSLLQHRATKLAFESINRPRNERSFVVSRSNFLGSGAYGGVWTGSHDGSFASLREQLPMLLQLSLHAIPMSGTDLCGSGMLPVGYEAESCARWIQFGAMIPFMRLHYDSFNTLQQDRQLYTWSEPARSMMQNALRVRYSLLPYLYTLMTKAHLFGDTVLRPLFFEYVSDPQTWDMDTQFMIGPSLLFVPAMIEGASEVRAYVPNDCWYDWFTHETISQYSPNKTEGVWVSLPAPFSTNATLPLLLRGGSIIPTQRPGMNVFSTRSSPYTLTVALDTSGFAAGWLIVDDGESLYQANKLYNFTFSAQFNLSASRVSGMINFTGWDPSISGVDVTNARVHRIVVIGLQSSAAEQSSFNASIGSALDDFCLSLNTSQLHLNQSLVIDVGNETVLALTSNWIVAVNDGCVLPPRDPEAGGPSLFIMLLVCGAIVIGVLAALTWFRSRGRSDDVEPPQQQIEQLPPSPPRTRPRPSDQRRRRHRRRESRRELLLDSDDDDNV